MGHFTASVYMNRIEQILLIPVLPFPNMLKLREERVCPKNGLFPEDYILQR